MQIFSKLQRNSAYYVLIKVAVYFIVLALNSQSYLFPIIIGTVFYCENVMAAVIYLSVFAILHEYPLVYLIAIFFVYRFFIHEKITAYIDRQYQYFVGIFVIYLLFALPFYPYGKFVVLYLLFNYLVDSFLVRIIRCEPKS